MWIDSKTRMSLLALLVNIKPSENSNISGINDSHPFTIYVQMDDI